MIRYKEYLIKRRGNYIHVNGLKAEIVEGNYLYETDRAGIKAKGGAKGLYRLLKKVAKKNPSEFHARTADSIINKIIEVGE